MEIKCKIYPNYYDNIYSHQKRGPQVAEREVCPDVSFGNSTDIYVKRPDVQNNASGLFGNKPSTLNVLSKLKEYVKNYKKNVQHTYEHKIIFALIEKELYGKYSIDSLTHDADKMILYLLGFPKSFVSKYHRKHSQHHPESGKRMNIRSMLCDNIASSPEFKPEKKNSLRKHFANSKELQSVNGFEELLNKYNFGEALNFDKIKRCKECHFKGVKGISRAVLKSFLLFIIH